MPHVIVEWTDDLPDDVLGDTDGVAHIRMATGQLQVERRCTITHEMVHVERGDTGCCDEKAELRVRKEAARRLITITELGEAMIFHGEHDDEALADELRVDVDTLLVRKAWLHPAERGYLRRRLEQREMGA
jgi:hypothetical protein